MSRPPIRPHGSEPPKKRKLDDVTETEDNSAPKKAPKLFPIFEKPGTKKTEQSNFHWLAPLGSKKTCLHGVNLTPENRPKVAAFDLDGCLIASTFTKKKKSSEPPDFRWWRNSIPEKLKEVHDSGYAVVVVTNQALRSAALTEWKKKMPLIGNALPEVPFRLLAATSRDNYRKPMPGIWYELERIYKEDNVQIDMVASFFVGDAAGRTNDHASTDRKWALNIGVPFYTPEEYFLKLPAAQYVLPGFHVSTLPTDLPRISPSTTPLVSTARSKPEVVVFVGFPSLGKSRFYRKHFEPAGYLHINQDTLKTRDKCVKAVREAVKGGHSCVVDNTNRNIETRKHYVDLARELDVPIRCVLFEGPIELAWHNNLYRAFNLPPSLAEKEHKRELVPYSGYTSFRAQYEEPQLSEGFSEIHRVNWVFEGNEEARKRWSMWLQIDGK